MAFVDRPPCTVEQAAERLRLPPPRDRWSEPWRHCILQYLAALMDIADFEGSTFGRLEARLAIEALRDDADDIWKLLEGR